MGSPYYRDMDEPTSPAGAGHHRSRSASRPPMSHAMDYPSNTPRITIIDVAKIYTEFYFYSPR